MFEATPVIPVFKMNSFLVSQCMDFTKHLVSKCAAFKFSLSLPTGFDFSMDFSQEKLTPSRRPEKKIRVQALPRETTSERYNF